MCCLFFSPRSSVFVLFFLLGGCSGGCFFCATSSLAGLGVVKMLSHCSVQLVLFFWCGAGCMGGLCFFWVLPCSSINLDLGWNCAEFAGFAGHADHDFQTLMAKLYGI